LTDFAVTVMPYVVSPLLNVQRIVSPTVPCSRSGHDTLSGR
jgi:hypothetical protein